MLIINDIAIMSSYLAINGESKIRSLVGRAVDVVMDMAEMVLSRREDDNIITYLVRVFMVIVVVLYIFHCLQYKYLDNYASQVKHSTVYLLELDN